MASLALFERAASYGDNVAIDATEGVFTYAQLLDASRRVASGLAGGDSLCGARVGLLVPPGFQFVAALWGVWRAGGIAVPLALSHPPPEWDYVVADAGIDALVVHGDFQEAASAVVAGREIAAHDVTMLVRGETTGAVPPARYADRALILYTSGTTGRPKGVVITHANIEAQVRSLVDAWAWSSEDRILLALPLHHVHGLINVLTCALWSGAVCRMLPRFEATVVWERFARDDLTMFMAVPTIYRRLITYWEQCSPDERATLSAACRKFRLMVSGSAALPVQTLERWREITGQMLLERYGMTEIGMALSNPLRGTRVPGRVGGPLPGVDVRVVDDTGHVVPPGTEGEIEVRGPTVFGEYWRRPEATRAAFRAGWFRTGDVAVVHQGSYQILGRNSVDIIKTGGYKVSALEIEEVIRTHPDIVECAVIAMQDEAWGERVCVAVESRDGRPVDGEVLRRWIGSRLAPYKVPKEICTVAALPRNAMGKVIKPEVQKLFARPAGGTT